jgi:hypothetical protein
MPTASASITSQISATYATTNTLATFSGGPSLTESLSLPTTTLNYVYNAVQAATASPVTYNVQSLTDVYGNAVNMATVYTIAIQNTGTHTIVVGTGTNALMGTDQVTLQAGHTVIITSPITVSGSVKNLLLTPSASTTWNIIILGA